MRQQSGFAIVVVLLVSVVAVLAFMFASSTLTLASRSSAAQERSATQALLAADSGLRTLLARASVVPFRQGTHGTIENWIDTSFATLDLGGGIRAEIETLGPVTEDEITVQSTGFAGGARRVLIQAFKVVEGDPILASVTVPGALTSVGSINNASAAMAIYGRENTEADWQYADLQACEAAVGEYVVVGTNVYEVIENESCSTDLAVRLVGQPSSQPLSPTQTATLRPTAIKEDLIVSESDNKLTSTVSVTDATRILFGVGTPITIGDATDGEPSSGTVSKVTTEEDEDGNVISLLTIEWDKVPAGNPPEGTVVRRHVSSGVTQVSCNIREDAFPQGCVDGVDLSDLFHRTFGIGLQDFKDSLDSSQIIYNQQLGDGRVLSGITWLSDPQNNVRDQKGSGILIIENNPGQAVTLNVSNDFTGLIYIIGDANIQGNQAMTGAVIVDGQATVFTNVQGVNDKIIYDPLELTRVLAGIEFKNPEAGGLEAAVANTWRVR